MLTTPQEIKQALREVTPFTSITESALEWFIEKAELRRYSVGQTLMKAGEPVDFLYVILEGQLQWQVNRNGQIREQGTVESGIVTGLLPFSRLKEAVGNSVATRDVTALALHRSHFEEMQCISYELVENLVGVMTNRVREFTRQQQQNEKLMSLGKLSAGLAHELNNPAAAVVRSAQELKKHLGTVPDKFKRVMSIRLEEHIVDQVNELVFSKMDAQAGNSLSLMERTQQEDEIADWLTDHQIDDEYDLAQIFVEFGFGTHELESIKTAVGNEFPPVVDWVANVLLTEKFVNDIQEASRRISTIVTAVKTFSHMDRDQSRDTVDIHEGINSTLTVMTHKLKEKKIQVQKVFQTNLPKINIIVGEMNQVWLNLTDNAIDAMPIEGTLQIITEQNGNFIWVTFIDSGAGIPSDILPNIFDPFFTTKPIGQGTGLGLDVVQKIIEQHRGSIKAESQPGRTALKVCLPVNQ